MSGSSETKRFPRLGWKRGLVATGVVVGLVLGFFVQQWDKAPFDERAYPSSRWDKSFDEIVDQFQVRPPDCQPTELHYWSGDYIDDNLYLTFAADSACVEDLLLSNHLTRGSTVSRADVAEFRDDKQRDWRWYEDSVDSYRRFRNRPLPGTELTVEVTTDGSPRRVYLRGVEF